MQGKESRRTIENSIAVTRTTPFLMRENVATDRFLLLLNQLDVGFHTFRLEPLCQFSYITHILSQSAAERGEEEKGERTGSDSGRVKSSERDQLNQESFFAEIPDEGFELFGGESMGSPIERRGQIVNEPPERFRQLCLGGTR